MQLEKIRSENTQVRWQDEDEADNCAQCKRDFTVTRRKVHFFSQKNEEVDVSETKSEAYFLSVQ